VIQDEVFLASEGDAWFTRNRDKLEIEGKLDWPTTLIEELAENRSGGASGDEVAGSSVPAIAAVLELGCATGWRLEGIRKRLNIRCVGVDASRQAIEYGRSAYPDVEFHQGTLAAVPLDETFDVVILQAVLHWVDRSRLAASVAEIDRLVRDGGFLSVGDFLPDFQQRRTYHHLPEQEIYTYKQDYARIFESLGTYRAIRRVTFEVNDARLPLAASDPDNRKSCTILHKSLQGFYADMG
jgi:SAM-dependent methyltransferase